MTGRAREPLPHDSERRLGSGRPGLVPQGHLLPPLHSAQADSAPGQGVPACHPSQSGPFPALRKPQDT